MKLTDKQLETLGTKYRLSPRERQVLALLFEGLPTSQDIADRLGTTSGAIQAAVRTLYLKTRTQSKHEMVLVCLDDVPIVQNDPTRHAEKEGE